MKTPIYEKYAKYYDIVNSDYFSWTDSAFFKFFEQLFRKMKPKNILDLACGTGRFSIPFAKQGYNVTALDIGKNMLSILRQKTKREKVKIETLNSDMTNFSIGKKFDIITCMYNAVYEISGKYNLIKMFRSVFNALENDGAFVYDLEDFSRRKFIEQRNQRLYNSNSRLYKKDGVVIFRSFHEYFDKKTNDFCWYSFMTVDDNGKISNITTEQKYKLWGYKNLVLFLRKAGFKRINCYSNLKRKTKYKIGDRFMVFVAEK